MPKPPKSRFSRSAAGTKSHKYSDITSEEPSPVTAVVSKMVPDGPASEPAVVAKNSRATSAPIHKPHAPTKLQVVHVAKVEPEPEAASVDPNVSVRLTERQNTILAAEMARQRRSRAFLLRDLFSAGLNQWALHYREGANVPQGRSNETGKPRYNVRVQLDSVEHKITLLRVVKEQRRSMDFVLQDMLQPGLDQMEASQVG